MGRVRREEKGEDGRRRKRREGEGEQLGNGRRGDLAKRPTDRRPSDLPPCVSVSFLSNARRRPVVSPVLGDSYGIAG